MRIGGRRAGLLYLAALAVTGLLAVGAAASDTQAANLEQPASLAAPARPEGQITIVPVPANAADPNAILGKLPDGTTTVALGTSGLSVVPVGPPLVWLPAALWLYHTGSTGWAIFLVIWGVGVVSMADNIVKPLLISKGTGMPLIWIMLGVLGGALAFGFLGVFIGPTLLAVAYALLRDWTIGSQDELAQDLAQDLKPGGAPAVAPPVPAATAAAALVDNPDVPPAATGKHPG